MNISRFRRPRDPERIFTRVEEIWKTLTREDLPDDSDLEQILGDVIEWMQENGRLRELVGERLRAPEEMVGFPVTDS